MMSLRSRDQRYAVERGGVSERARGDLLKFAHVGANWKTLDARGLRSHLAAPPRTNSLMTL